MSRLLKDGFLKHSLSNNRDSFPYEIKLGNGIRIIHHDVGVIEVCPFHSDIALVISAGIHGDETAPLEMIDDMVNNILNLKLQPKIRVLFIIAHPFAINSQQRFININLNRCFSNGTLGGDPESRIAVRLKNHVSLFFLKNKNNQSKWHFDLHCSIRDSLHPIFALVPTSTKMTDVRPLVSFLQCAHLDAVIFSQEPSSTFSWWSAETCSSFSATIEMGRVAPLYQNNMQAFSALSSALKRMIQEGVIESVYDPDPSLALYQISNTMIKKDKTFRFSFSKETPNFTYFSQGQKLAKEKALDHVAMMGGESILFPNENVEEGQRACLLIQPFSLDFSRPFYVTP